MLYTRAAFFVTVVGIGLALFGGLVGFIGFPKLVASQIKESFKLVEGSDTFEKWKNVQTPVVCKFYFFNVSNPLDVQNGAKPIVEEIGPYVYKQYRKKLNVTTTDDILSYYQYQHFEFDEKSSAPLTQTDEITVLNVPLMSAALIAEESTGDSAIGLRFFDSYLSTIFDNPDSVFMRTTPKDLLFDGVYLMCNSSSFVQSIVCNLMESFTSSTTIRLDDGRFRFSFYGHKNATRGDYYSVNSGTRDIHQLGNIVAWGNSTTSETWSKNGTCNKISGTDGGTFAPFKTQNSQLNVFNADICRSVTATYRESVAISGIDAYRYIIDDSTFTSPSNYSKNHCFCLKRTKGITGDDGCLLDGTLELWGCQGAPVIITMPHFYLANEVYQNGVIGLEPNKSRHEMYLDLEPMSGVVLHAGNKAQVNMFIKPITSIDLTANLPTTLMPVYWIDESYSLIDENVDLLRTQLLDVLDILTVVKWCTLIFGLVLTVCGLICLLKSIWGPPETITKVPNGS